MSSLCRLFLLFVFIVNGSSQRFDVDESIAKLVSSRRAQLFSVADSCVTNLGTSLGEEFLTCVITTLKDKGSNTTTTNSNNEDTKGEENLEVDDLFPVPPYTLHPLTITHELDENYHGQMFLDLLRNYTCGRIQDGGSPVIETSTWTYDEKKEMEALHEKTCPADLLDDDATKDEQEQKEPEYTEVQGYLPQGNDLSVKEVDNVNKAKALCDKVPNCEGFTQLKDGDTVQTFFKSKASLKSVNFAKNWRSFVKKNKKKQIPSHCLAGSSSTEKKEEQSKIEYKPPKEHKIEILRHEPLVAIIPNFASNEDCEMLIKAGGSDEDMGRAFETGGPSSYRRSYSSNIDVDYEDSQSDMTRFAERMFAFVRNITEYEVYGPGQEPINAVLYKDVGDEYRPHCDGPCNGGAYPHGSRVATSIVYCEIPDGDGNIKGSGQTSFTRSGMMVSPRKGDFLLFTYKFKNGTVDNGFTEHSGCPILGGRKWIATQWYREGVDYDFTWDMAADNADDFDYDDDEYEDYDEE